jgi:serine protease inhibitor
LVLLPACANVTPKPTPTATPPVPVGDATFADGRGLQIGFKLLYAMDSEGGNNVLGTLGLSQVLAAAKYGAAGETAMALEQELGMQGMLPRQVNEVALRMRQSVAKIKQGRITTAWCVIFGDGQYVKESYLTETKQSLQLTSLFPPMALEGETGKAYLDEWADDNTGGRVKQVEIAIPEQTAPFFVDILTADPDWQVALDTGKSRPLPFQFESGEENAVPTMVCYQSCGIYESVEGSMAVLPLAGDEARLVVMVPPEGLALHEFISVAAARHDDWLDKATWAKQRVLLPRFKLEFSGSAMPVLDRAGLAGLLGKDADYSAMGNGLYFSDVLHMASLIMDESGVEVPDPSVTYRQGVKDDIPTLAVSRPFLVLLERTDPDGFNAGQILLMGFVRDPLNAAIK